MMTTEELEIQQTPDELFDLETLITEGTDSRIPITIEFPNGKKAAAMIRPISTSEFQTIYKGDASNILINILETGLMNKKGESLPRNLIGAMPVGLPAKIVKQIFDISGIEFDEKEAQELAEKLELFPQL